MEVLIDVFNLLDTTHKLQLAADVLSQGDNNLSVVLNALVLSRWKITTVAEAMNVFSVDSMATHTFCDKLTKRITWLLCIPHFISGGQPMPLLTFAEGHLTDIARLNAPRLSAVTLTRHHDGILNNKLTALPPTVTSVAGTAFALVEVADWQQVNSVTIHGSHSFQKTVSVAPLAARQLARALEAQASHLLQLTCLDVYVADMLRFDEFARLEAVAVQVLSPHKALRLQATQKIAVQNGAQHQLLNARHVLLDQVVSVASLPWECESLVLIKCNLGNLAPLVQHLPNLHDLTIVLGDSDRDLTDELLACLPVGLQQLALDIDEKSRMTFQQCNRLVNRDLAQRIHKRLPGLQTILVGSRLPILRNRHIFGDRLVCRNKI